MKTFPIQSIEVGERQRKEFAEKALQELKASIAAHGLIHPIVLTEGGQLIAGERRLRAIIELHQEGITFNHNLQPVPHDEIPFTLVSDIDPTDLAEIEFAENVFRVDLSWQERTQALQKLHTLRKAENPKQTVSATAKEVIAASGSPISLDRGSREIAEALIVAEHLDDPEVKRARSSSEAYHIILDRAEATVKANAIKVVGDTSSFHSIIHGDCIEEMKKLPSNSVDTILVDPPYGMNADKMGKGEYHLYDDSPGAALAICRAILSEGFRITKPRAILFMFCDVEHFITLRTFAAQQAWTCWRQPLVWRKGADGHSPWGRAGFIRTTEFLLFAVKGQKELVYPGGPDVLDYKRVGRGVRVHSAEKPVPLLRHLLRISTLPGQTVLDPCAGSGAAIEAATLEKAKIIAIEKDERFYNACINRLSVPTQESEEAAGIESDIFDGE